MNYLVTEGAHELGAGIVRGLIERGHNVAFTYLDPAQADTAEALAAEAQGIREGARCRAYKLDLRSSQEVDEVLTQIVEDFDTIEVLVNAADHCEEGPTEQMTPAQWQAVIDINLTGTFYVCRSLMTTLLSNRYGRIINLSSIYAGGGAHLANYAASKAAVHGLTKTIAKEYGRKGITANALLLGCFEQEQGPFTPERRAFWKKVCPSRRGRAGRIEELVGFIDYLGSEEGGFVNGQLISLSGSLDWGK